jgi:hypothetical protein
MFWEKLFACFALIRHGLHRKRFFQLLEAMLSLRSVPKLYKHDNFRLLGIRSGYTRHTDSKGIS